MAISPSMLMSVPSKSISDIDLDLTYILLIKHLSEQIKLTLFSDTPTCVKAKYLTEFVQEIERKHFNRVSSRSYLIRQLFYLHQICKALERFNEEELDLSYREFRLKVYYPNIIYILIRLLPKARSFLQKMIRTIFDEYKRRAGSVVLSHTTSFYMDMDVIKTDILYDFLGNAMKKLNPLDVNNVDLFYKQVFRNILFYYFKGKQRLKTELIDNTIENPFNELVYIPTGLAIYRDVMYDLQVEKMYQTSLTLNQVRYNFNIFRNVILSNEFQNIYISTQKDSFLINNEQYKLLKLYNDDIDDKLDEIKKLPTIYRLLKCVRIFSKSHCYMSSVVNPQIVKTAVMEELIHPFRNMLCSNNIYEILERVAENFSNSVLSGEYINLMTLSPLKIKQVTFVNQLKKFVRLCLRINE